MATATDGYQLLIGGKWRDGSDGTYEIINPATEEVVAEAPEASADDVRATAPAAADAFPAWSRTDPRERAALLEEGRRQAPGRAHARVDPAGDRRGGRRLLGGFAHADPCGDQPLRALRPRQRSPTSLAPFPRSRSVATPLAPGALMGGVANRVPVGVVACISPYNFPTTDAVGKIAPALAVGCTVVMKPAPQDPLCVLELAKILDEVGFPPGVVNIVTGAKPEVGAVLVDDDNVDMVSFTGSTPVGIKIMEAGARTMKRQLQELGGKGACIVTDDADLNTAIGGMTSVWAFHSGQICTAPTRVIVHRSGYDHLVGGLAKAAGDLKVGDPPSPTPSSAPSSRRAARPHRGHIRPASTRAPRSSSTAAPGHGPRLLRRPDPARRLHEQMTPVHEEIFGPVVVVVPFDDEDEAIAIPNDSDFGLSATCSPRTRPRLTPSPSSCAPATSASTPPSATTRRRSAGSRSPASAATAATTACTSHRVQTIVWPG